MLRRPLARKKVDGWARAAMRSSEVDDIGMEVGCVPVGGFSWSSSIWSRNDSKMARLKLEYY